ncbi:hypothetical protein LAZ67_15002163 [Cordylochernes scorpioides]|uniref:Uncharacterized protein n=1 Tax=Cordylochernes scorpioides TaxID=51811 RepID=A0ABY6L9P3_9ARAC|nr:hypothetical protein LAZ67_15002163 [Cordylochernes scorpioides]
MSLEDKVPSGRPLILDDGDLQTRLEPSSSTRELSDVLGIGKLTIHRHLKQLDLVHKKPHPRSARTHGSTKTTNEFKFAINPLEDHFWKSAL